jgi:hypothetical protein
MAIGNTDTTPYAVHDEDGRFTVAGDAGRAVMVCSDRRSAEHYALLLNAAFEAGYKAGFRAARDEFGNPDG